MGDPGDVDFVELLLTTLLVQADTAMLRLGRRSATSISNGDGWAAGLAAADLALLDVNGRIDVQATD